MSRVLRLLAIAAVVWCGPGAGVPVGGAEPGRAAQQDAAVAQPGPDALPRTFTNRGTRHKLIVPARNRALYERLVRQRAIVHEVDYGSFRMVVVDETRMGGRTALAALEVPVRDEANLIAFNGYVLDTTAPLALARRLPAELRQPDVEADVPRSLRPRLDLTQAGDRAEAVESGRAPAGTLFVVQFIGPVRDEWLDAVAATGARLVHYVPANAYVVRARGDAVAKLRALREAEPFVQFIGRYEPAFRLAPRLRALRDQAYVDPTRDEAVDLNVQVIVGEEADQTLAELRALAIQVYAVNRVLNYVNVGLRAPSSRLTAIAQMDGVFAVDPRSPRQRLDEAQGMVLAGQVLSDGRLSGPGYLEWLSSRGFTSAQFDSFVINVVDDALVIQGHPDLASSRVAFQLNPTHQTGVETGHGFLNTQIAGGYSTSTGSTYQDSSGFRYGLGVAPFARIGSTAVFGTGSATAVEYEAQAYALGARISNNSWGYTSTKYDVDAQEADAVVRDAQPSVAGQQQLVMVFSAGNGGAKIGAGSVTSPGTAKNIITVGASENVRPNGTDGCGRGATQADSANDMALFSSLGPVNGAGGDGRFKPDLVAPGTHVQGGVPQSNYDGSELCNTYWPAGQTLYSWSSGTSHATSAVSGAAALVSQYFRNQGRPAPSPAMAKAFLMSSAAYMAGVGGHDTLPSNSQGMGRVDLGRAFDGGSRVLTDQTTVFTATGETYRVTGTAAATDQPLRVTLAWTDAPGPTSGAPWVNDLDLEVTLNGTPYLGNVFSGAESVTGGTADARNNVESVFLPAGVAGTVTITVRAANIAGDGVPGAGDATDQDFALVASNVRADEPEPSVTLSPDKVSPQPAGTTVTWTATPAGGVAPQAYKWWVNDGTGWTVLRDWDTSPDYTWRPAAAGTYQIEVWMRSSGSVADAAEAMRSSSFAVTPAPTVTSVSPTWGPVTGGTTVTVTGAAFQSGAVVTFGGVPGTGATVENDTTITVVTDTHGSGAVDVVVANATGSPGTLVGGFTYVAPASDLHPADRSGDNRMSVSEVTGYGAAWKRGAAWLNAPVPIPISYVTRAGYVWRTGETYRKDPGECPTCWVPTQLNPAGLALPERSGLAAAVAGRIGGTAAADVAEPRPSEGMPPGAVAAVMLVADKPSPQPAGTPVTWTAVPSGATAPLAYKWWFFDGQLWRVMQEWSPDATCTWTPEVAGSYRIGVWVRRAGDVGDTSDADGAVTFVVR